MSNVLSALQHIDVAAVSYQEWVNVGMALKAEGFDWTVWDDWSRNDPRYHPGECQRKWATFRGSATPITGGSIVQMAKDYGWTPCSEGAALDWNDTIMDDGDNFNQYTAPDTWNPAQELITYLETLFDKDDFVGYVTNENAPYAVCVLVENGGSGGGVAAPLARKTLKKAISLGL